MIKHEKLIPKIIHWSWLGNEPVPDFLKACMDSWRRRLPDYTIKCWTQSDFDIHSVPWVEQAVEEQKWAFAADYIRLHALYTQGGIYLDSDVEVLRSLDPLLRYECFTAGEYNPLHYKYIETSTFIDNKGIPHDRNAFVPGYGLQAAILGAAKGAPFIRECMLYYENRNFRETDGTLHTELTMPLVIAKIAERHGFRYIDEDQTLDGGRLFIGSNRLFPSSILLLRSSTRAFHHCAGSWLNPEERIQRQRIGYRRLPLILKYTAKSYWWRIRRQRRANKQR